MSRPKFTEEQEQWLCGIIDFWYIKWQKRITSHGEPHRLGVAKEQLKELMFGNHPQETLVKLIES